MNLGPTLMSMDKTKKSLMVMLHGYGSDGHDLLSLAPLWQKSAPWLSFLSPHGVAPCEVNPSGRQWFSLQDWSHETLSRNLEMALDTVKPRIQEALDTLSMDIKDVYFMGFSQGSMLALALGLHTFPECRGILSFSGGYVKPHHAESGPSVKPTILLVHGDQDTVVPPSFFHATKDTLKALGCLVEDHLIQGLDHGIDPTAVGLGKAFLTSPNTIHHPL